MIAFVHRPVSHGKKARMFSARIRLETWSKVRTFPLQVTDDRVAKQKLAALLRDLEREEHGIGVPKPLRDAAQKPINGHVLDFIAEMKAAGRSANTLSKYGNALPKLCTRCGWVMLRDITTESFTAWRASSGLKPKTVNDLLGVASAFIHWLERRRLVLADPLKHVQKVSNVREVPFRRALSIDEITRLFKVAPFHRAAVYQAIFYLGLRRNELHNLKWGDVNLDASPAALRVPASIAKNRKASSHVLRPELVTTLRSFRPTHAGANDFVFRGTVPRIPTFKTDLKAAGIDFEDERGSRIDLHGLRTTFVTQLLASGADPYAVMKLARHSDIRLTTGTYTDPAQMKFSEKLNLLPSLPLEHAAPITAQAGDVPSRSTSSDVASWRNELLSQTLEPVASGHEKAPQDNPRRFPKMERAKRLELIAQLFEELKNQIRYLKAESADALIDAHAETPHPSFGDIRGDGSLKTRDPIPEGGRVLGREAGKRESAGDAIEKGGLPR